MTKTRVPNFQVPFIHHAQRCHLYGLALRLNVNLNVNFGAIHKSHNPNVNIFDAPSPLCYTLMHKARGGHTFSVAGWAELLPQKIWRAQKFVQKSLAGKLQPYNNLIETHNCASLTLNMPLITIITSNHTKCSSSFCNCVLFYQVLQNS